MPLYGDAVPLTFTFRTGRWSASWPMTVLTLLAVVVFALLGRWQWHRADYKRALAAAFAAGNAAPQELGSRPAAQLPRYSQLRVHGSYDGAHQFLLENLSHEGMPGYEVLTPLQLSDGRTLLVNRGWLPLTRSRSELPDVALKGPQQASPAGRLDALPVAGIALGHQAPDAAASWPRLTSFPTLGDLSAALGRPLEAWQLLLNPDEPEGYVRDWQMGGFGPERHVAYAVQWWAFGVIALVLYARLHWQRSRP
jgi:surfeit locus 1 family protein